MKYFVFMVLAVLVAGCGEYVPREEFKVKTVDGKTITLLCPVVDAKRSKFTYVIESECVLSGVE